MIQNIRDIERYRFSRCICYLGLIVTLFCLTACTKSVREWPPINGQVLDAETDQPIEGAVVIGNWEGVASYSKSQCFHIERDITDKQGKFTLPGWINDSDSATYSRQHVTKYVHKYGFRESDKTYKTQSYRENIFYLERDDSAPADRLKYLSALIVHVACGDQDKKTKLFPVEKAIYLEAAGLANTKEETEHLGYIRHSIVQSWVPVDVWGTLHSGDEYNNYFEEHVKEDFLSADY